MGEYIPGGRTDGSGGGVTGVCCLDGGRGNTYQVGEQVVQEVE